MSNENKNTTVDIIDVSKRVLAGDQRAEETFYHTLRPPIYHSLYKISPGYAEDATQEGLTEVFTALPRFDPTRGKGTPERNMYNWALSIAQYKERRRIRKRRKKHEIMFSDLSEEMDGNTSEIDYRNGYNLFRLDPELRPVERSVEEADEPELDTEQLRSDFRMLLSEILPEQLFSIVESRLNGRSNAAIAAELGWIPNTISTKLAADRKIIEDRLIKPAGFKRVSYFGDSALNTAAYRGSMQATMFLDMQYTTDEWVEDYRANRGKKEKPVAETVIFNEKDTERVFKRYASPDEAADQELW
jgi:RNA polymerase sigma factor (sigma-70 family)